ncbi:histamine H2 receptor-like [Tubulanus polymorphus]|uniref:histamine H2 receptor-like n=1 Tax=Tubulanus polymorphus TaxID=672921 RepID=UPI003DA65A6D
MAVNVSSTKCPAGQLIGLVMAFQGSIALVILFGSGILIVYVVTKPNLRSYFTTLLVSMAGADLAAGINMLLATFGGIFRSSLSNVPFCFVLHSFATLSLVSSCIHVVLIGINRYTAVKYPIKHKKTRPILHVFKYMCRMGNTCAVHDNPLRVDEIVRILVCKSKRQIAPTAVRFGVRQYTMAQLRTTIRVSMAIFCSFTICWMPYLVVEWYIRFHGPSDIVLRIRYIVYIVVFINSSFNPIIYTVCNADFKKAVQSVLCCLKRRCQHQLHEQTTEVSTITQLRSNVETNVNGQTQKCGIS